MPTLSLNDLSDMIARVQTQRLGMMHGIGPDGQPLASELPLMQPRDVPPQPAGFAPVGTPSRETVDAGPPPLHPDSVKAINDLFTRFGLKDFATGSADMTPDSGGSGQGGAVAPAAPADSGNSGMTLDDLRLAIPKVSRPAPPPLQLLQHSYPTLTPPTMDALPPEPTHEVKPADSRRALTLAVLGGLVTALIAARSGRGHVAGEAGIGFANNVLNGFSRGEDTAFQNEETQWRNGVALSENRFTQKQKQFTDSVSAQNAQRQIDAAGDRDLVTQHNALRHDYEFDTGQDDKAAAATLAATKAADAATHTVYKDRGDLYEQLRVTAGPGQQQILRDAEADGELARLGVTIPKDPKTGQFDVSGFETAAAVDARDRQAKADEQKAATRRANAVNTAVNVTDPQAYWKYLDDSGEAASMGLELHRDPKTGKYLMPDLQTRTDANASANHDLAVKRFEEEKSYHQRTLALTSARDEATRQARAAAAAVKAGGVANGGDVKTWTAFSEALGQKSTIDAQIYALKGKADTEENRTRIRDLRAKGGAIQGRLDALRTQSPAVGKYIDGYLGANQDAIKGGHLQVTNGTTQNLPASVRGTLNTLRRTHNVTISLPSATGDPVIDSKGNTSIILRQSVPVGAPVPDTDSTDLIDPEIVHTLRKSGATVQTDERYGQAAYRVTFPAAGAPPKVSTGASGSAPARAGVSSGSAPGVSKTLMIGGRRVTATYRPKGK